MILLLQGDDAQTFIDVVDKVRSTLAYDVSGYASLELTSPTRH